MNSVRFFLFTTLTAASAAQRMTTICPYDSRECNCRDTTVECFNLEKIPPLQTGVNVTNVTIADFENGNIVNVFNNSLPPGLQKLVFNHHPLTNISDDAFESSATTLEELSISDAAFTELPNALLQLTNLTTLEIASVNVESWGNETLQNIESSLLRLSLFNAGLTSWPDAFSALHVVTQIYIERSLLSSIPDDAFSLMEHSLQELSVINSHLIEIPQTANLTRLVTLYLSYNSISEMTSDRLPGNLQYLYLDNNKLTEITDSSFPNNSLLITLHLDSNPISTISSSSFEKLVHLSHLSLSFTKLTQIPIAVTSLTALTSLDLTIYFDSFFSCPCPPRGVMTSWYESYNGTLQVNGNCNNYILDLYLRGSACLTPPATTTTSATTTTTSKNTALSTVGNVYFAYGFCTPFVSYLLFAY